MENERPAFSITPLHIIVPWRNIYFFEELFQRWPLSVISLNCPRGTVSVLNF